ncbi:acyl-CoA thioester hydrolase [Algoriphagus ratkowskyi]|uniref:Acyl-CoA thioester hydrolase n=1 Tax=Algoriphagus ratkowskyi TaxID=57028 RepID=A0A2W7RPK2_9BACT|nr:thioesterase family protein [Algoriphagus ratkowskyi]PZX60430.1 acyl-CoA thioester hydrolase [Algoriphagus ratkowskyi]TXD78239.1 acyl-CoA thioesterase [Algoriphagus ratkowskyi]
MYTTETQIRVRYAETDQMSYVYYGNYAMYFEVARVEAMRSIGFSYKEMEDEGVMMPVLESYFRYLKPGKYDELLTIKTTIPTLPSARIRFEYEVFNEQQELITEGWTTLTFLKKDSHRPTRPPQNLLALLNQYFH